LEVAVVARERWREQALLKVAMAAATKEDLAALPASLPASSSLGPSSHADRALQAPPATSDPLAIEKP